MKDDDVLKFIDQIYDAALTPENWPRVLSDIASALGGPLATILPLSNPSMVVTSPGFEQAVGVYAEHWWKNDTILAAVLQRRGLRGALSDWTMLQTDKIAHDPFYQDFRRDFGLGHWVGANLELHPGELYSFAVQLARGTAPLDQAAFKRFELISRHVGRAMAITGRLSTASLGASELVETLSCLQGGAAILDGDGTVLVVNAAFERLAADGLRVVRGRMATARSEDQAGLDRLIQKADGNFLGPQDPSIIVVEKPSGRRPFLIRAMPLSRKQNGWVRSGRSSKRQVLVLVADLDSETTFQPQEALQLLGLTPAEARVAALVGSGRSVRATAELVGSAEGTVRNQLKQVFSKLELVKQSDLVHLVDRISVLGTS